MVEYTWDPDKEMENVRRRGISFAEAKTVLRGYLKFTWFDELHSAEELRFKTIGYSDLGRILVVVTSEDGVRPGSFPHGAPRSANVMRTNDDGNPDFADILESGKVEIGRYAGMEADGFGIVIDGAVGYSLRLIPSNKILGRFASTREAWPAVLGAVERGMPAKCLILDWHWANGRRGRVSSGRLLVMTARSGLGLDVTQHTWRAAS